MFSKVDFSKDRDMLRLMRLTSIMDVLEARLGLFVEFEPELEDKKDRYSDLIVPLTFENMPSSGRLRICYEGGIYFDGNDQVAFFFMRYCIDEYRERLSELI